MSPLSRRVEAAGIAGIRRKQVPSDIQPADFFEDVDRVRGLFAKLVNAPAERIAVVPSASYGLGIVARNVTLSARQNVVTVHHQFPANVYPWRRLCAETGAELRVVQPPEGSHRGDRWNTAILSAIDEATGLIAVGNVHWSYGTIIDLDTIGERAREVGAVLVVDGTQSVGAMPFDVERVRPDALVCAAYKWLTGPYAIGAAYFGPRFDDGVPLEETWIGRKGSEDFGGLVQYQDDYRPGAARYDVGETSNFILVPMLVSALEQVLEWGPSNIAVYTRDLMNDFLIDAVDAGFGVEEPEWRAPHLFSLGLQAGQDVRDLHAALAAQNVFVSARGDVLRISPHLYNDEDDVMALREALAIGPVRAT